MTAVLVSGASVAGPATAYWLAHQGYSVTVAERHDGPRPGGQAIDVRGPALSVLQRMGLLQAAEDMKTRMRGASFVDRDGNELSRDTESTPTGGVINNPDIEILRDDLVAVLHGALDAGVEFLFGDSITGLDDRGDAVAVSFERADARDFDLVIGADGLHSNVRRLAFGPRRAVRQAVAHLPGDLHGAQLSAPRLLADVSPERHHDGAPLARDDFYRVVHSIELKDN
jgi:2-polyprenyl-6-methoxyphenol hydroxylase-like FAD-dependent oxidoreductase